MTVQYFRRISYSASLSGFQCLVILLFVVLVLILKYLSIFFSAKHVFIPARESHAFFICRMHVIGSFPKFSSLTISDGQKEEMWALLPFQTVRRCFVRHEMIEKL